MNVITAIVGMSGSGKSVVADALKAEGFQYLRFGQVCLDEVKRRGLPPTEEHERPIREQLRKEHGMGAFALLNIPKIDAMLQDGHVVVDGLYSWSEYKILKERYGDQLRVLAVHAPPHVRYARLEGRQLRATDTALRDRPIMREHAQKRDHAEIENIEKGGPIAMADYHLVNNGTPDELCAGVNAFLGWLRQNDA